MARYEKWAMESLKRGRVPTEMDPGGVDPARDRPVWQLAGYDIILDKSMAFCGFFLERCLPKFAMKLDVPIGKTWAFSMLIWHFPCLCWIAEGVSTSMSDDVPSEYSQI